MSANPNTPVFPLAIGALVLVMLGGLVAGVGLFKESSRLQAELAALRSESPSAARADDTASVDEIARISAEIEKETALKRAADAKAMAIGRSLPRMSNEQWRSLGSVEELGRQAGDFLQMFSDLAAQVREGKPAADFDGAAFEARVMSWIRRMAAVGEMEGNPAEIARLHTAALGSRLNLDGPTQTRVREQIEREFALLQEAGLTRPQRPDTGRADWYSRRRQALIDATARIEELISPSQRIEHVVGQSLHLGTGLRTTTELRADGHGSVSVAFTLPGLSKKF